MSIKNKGKKEGGDLIKTKNKTERSFPQFIVGKFRKRIESSAAAPY